MRTLSESGRLCRHDRSTTFPELCNPGGGDPDPSDPCTIDPASCGSPPGDPGDGSATYCGAEQRFNGSGSSDIIGKPTSYSDAYDTASTRATTAAQLACEKSPYVCFAHSGRPSFDVVRCKELPFNQWYCDITASVPCTYTPDP